MMKIITNKITFEAKDNAEAMRISRERLGKDAVILSSHPVKTGGVLGFFKKSVLSVSAGIYEEDAKDAGKKDKSDDVSSFIDQKKRIEAFQKILEFRQGSEMKAPLISANQNTRQINPSNSYVNPALIKDAYQSSGDRGTGSNNVIKQSNSNASFSEIRGEVHSLSEQLSSLVKKLNEHSFNTETNESATYLDENCENIYRILINNEMSSNYAKKLIDEYVNSKNEITFWDWLPQKVNTASTDPIIAVGGKRIAFVGPTGVGKTTTIAKLATMFSLWEHKSVLLLTSDTFRIAAVEQHKTYAKILGIPTEVVFDPDGIDAILENHENTDIILLDTAGRNQKDTRHIDAFNALFKAFRPDAIHLVLAANLKYKDMIDVVDKISPLGVTHLVFTKLDETTSYGAIFDVADRLGKPISFFTAGQNVPNDIEVASGEYLCKMIYDSKN
ncbi:MAG: flagellar biosynthesis protein FlhF [Synergistaceae bacterium]|nr:flagellar biosynthesis protein FlhF [Synergistaceae bacterium]